MRTINNELSPSTHSSNWFLKELKKKGVKDPVGLLKTFSEESIGLGNVKE